MQYIQIHTYINKQALLGRASYHERKKNYKSVLDDLDTIIVQYTYVTHCVCMCVCVCVCVCTLLNNNININVDFDCVSLSLTDVSSL